MENNKLIAEFMAFPKQQDAVDDRTIAYYIGDVIKADNRHNENEDDVFHPDDMQFHKSWDWLMPVVRKCKESESYEDSILYHKLEDALLSRIDRDDTYKAVVEFINEYNNRIDGKK
jgi:hypothetical protein